MVVDPEELSISPMSPVSAIVGFVFALPVTAVVDINMP